MARHARLSLDEALELDLERVSLWLAHARMMEDRECAKFGLLAATIANFSGRAKRTLKIADFFPRLAQGPKPVLSAKQLEAVFKGWASAQKKNRKSQRR